ncbi:MAG: ferrous iron transport protein A [Planctomycetes bacterium]|nr:ferrous iron transport protein A [Planctomycetota bacterium]
MSLASIAATQTVRITGIRGSGAISYRLMEMGLIEGAEVQVIGRAPLGDPLQVRLGDYRLSLRCGEAELIEVSEL